MATSEVITQLNVLTSHYSAISGVSFIQNKHYIIETFYTYPYQMQLTILEKNILLLWYNR